MSIDSERILATLNLAQIQTKQPALYQAFTALLRATAQIQTNYIAADAALVSSLNATFTFGTAANRAAYKPQNAVGNLVFFFETDTGRLYLFGDATWNPVGAPIDATYLTVDDESADLPNSRQLLAGTNVTFDDSVANERTVNVTASVDHVVLSDGATPTPAPVDDGAGNFIYIEYTP